MPRLIKEGNNYYIDWTPDGSNIDPIHGGKYALNLILKAGVGDCSASNILDTQKPDEILIAAGDDLPTKVTFTKSIPYTFATEDKSVVFENKLRADFSPSITLSGKLVDSDYTEADAKLHAVFSVKDLATLKMAFDTDRTFDPKPIYTKRFSRIVMAGPVPIVFTGQLKFMAVAELNSTAKVDAVLDTGMSFTLDYGMHYDGTRWQPIKKVKSTYHIKLQADGEAEATMTIRLIPDLHVELYSLAAVHLLAEPYIYATAGVHGHVMANADSSGHDYLDYDIGFTKMEAGAGVDLHMHAGAAWDTKFKSLKWPENATYAKIGGASFMNPKHRKFLREYYDQTRTYKKFTPVDKTVLASIPKIEGKVDYTAKPPSNIDSRAILIDLSHKNVPNPLSRYGIGPKYPVTFIKWDQVGAITNNALIQTVPASERVWVIPQSDGDGSYTDVTVKCVAHSSMGTWARQYIKLTLDQGIAVSKDFMPPYWKSRYGLSNEGDDDDGDGYTNFEEFKAGTDPIDPKSKPESHLSADSVSPVITITGDNPATLTVGDTYTDAGAVAIDDVDGNIKVTIIENTVDTLSVGTYRIVYHAEDSAGNETNATRIIQDINPDINLPSISNFTVQEEGNHEGKVKSSSGIIPRPLGRNLVL